MEEFTRKFNVAQEKDAEIRHILTTVYAALEDKGYNPINQIVGYILSEDPTYITNHNNARTLIRKLDRDELLQTPYKIKLPTCTRKKLEYQHYRYRQGQQPALASPRRTARATSEFRRTVSVWLP